MICEIEENKIYKSLSNTKFKVLYKAKHAQDCSITMIVYTNIEDTFDSKIGIIWVIEESLFLKRFTEC